MKKILITTLVLAFALIGKANAFSLSDAVSATQQASTAVNNAATAANSATAAATGTANAASSGNVVTDTIKSKCTEYMKQAETYTKNNNMAMTNTILTLYEQSGCEEVTNISVDKLKSMVGM